MWRDCSAILRADRDYVGTAFNDAGFDWQASKDVPRPYSRVVGKLRDPFRPRLSDFGHE
jgi:hypothetical protein